MLPLSSWPPLVVQAVLEQHAAEALHDAAAHLLVDELRVDDRAAVLHAPVLQELDEAGVGVDLEIASACTPLVNANGHCRGT